jgi:UDP-N-acetylmuramate dehydrogenase
MTFFSEHTTLRIGGPIDEWIHTTTMQQVVDEVLDSDANRVPVLVLGGGSNVVAPDAGFRGRVVHIATRGIEVVEPGVLRIAAGEAWDDVVSASVERGWAGIEALAGIPGLSGATPIQNVGAYGQDVSQVLMSLTVLERASGQIVDMGPEQCGFGYRTSALKREPHARVVLEVTLRLRPSTTNVVTYPELARALGIQVGESAPLVAIRDAVVDLRRSKGMVLDEHDHDTWSAGSFFTNPIVDAGTAARFPPECPRYPAVDGVKLSAAWLIEAAGMGRGFRISSDARAAVSNKHSLALVNLGGATSGEVMELAHAVQVKVRAMHDVALDSEPVVLMA